MQLELMRYKEPMEPGLLVPVLSGALPMPVESTGEHVDFDPVRVTLEQLLASDAMGKRSSGWDAELAPVLHGALRRCSRRTLLDMRFWHWMAVAEMRDFVLRRWCSAREVTTETVLKSNEAGHFLGRPTLNGVSRNGVARLYWSAEALYTPEEGYGLVPVVLGSQDFFKGIFERRFCLHRPAARACAKALAGRTEDERRDDLRLLNLYASTIVLEALDEDGVRKLVTP